MIAILFSQVILTYIEIFVPLDRLISRVWLKKYVAEKVAFVSLMQLLILLFVRLFWSFVNFCEDVIPAGHSRVWPCQAAPRFWFLLHAVDLALIVADKFDDILFLLCQLAHFLLLFVKVSWALFLCRIGNRLVKRSVILKVSFDLWHAFIILHKASKRVLELGRDASRRRFPRLGVWSPTFWAWDRVWAASLLSCQGVIVGLALFFKLVLDIVLIGHFFIVARFEAVLVVLVSEHWALAATVVISDLTAGFAKSLTPKRRVTRTGIDWTSLHIVANDGLVILPALALFVRVLNLRLCIILACIFFWRRNKNLRLVFRLGNFLRRHINFCFHLMLHGFSWVHLLLSTLVLSNYNIYCTQYLIFSQN